MRSIGVRRFAQLYAGLVLYGSSAALQVRAALGLDPWDVFHQGVSERSGLTIGVVSIIVGAAVLLLWVPLRQRPGIGTVSNVFVVGLAMDGTLHLVPALHHLGIRIPLLLSAVVLNGVATGLYISARLGPGPRDGLMTGLHAATGRSIRLVRTGIEAAVLVTGFLLGGSVGIGTVVYALSIGPLAQLFLRVFAIPEVEPASGPKGPAGRERERDLEGLENVEVLDRLEKLDDLDDLDDLDGPDGPDERDGLEEPRRSEPQWARTRARADG